MGKEELWSGDEPLNSHVPLSFDLEKLQRQFKTDTCSDELLQCYYNLKHESAHQHQSKGPSGSSASDVILLGNRLGLNFYRILALVLKVEWEKGARPIDDDGLENGYETTFLSKTDVSNLYSLFEQKGGLTRKAGYPWPHFETLVHEMIMAAMHKVANDSPELRAFACRMENASGLLHGGTKEQNDIFWAEKNTWLHLQDELGSCLTLLERCRIENATIRRTWMTEFGKDYCSLQEQVKRLEGLQTGCDLLRADPSLGAAELEELVLQAEKERQDYLEKIRLEVLFSSIAKGYPGITLTDEKVFQAYKNNYKKLLRRIWLSMHPDQLQNNPLYSRLTGQQKDFLKQLWNDLMEIRPEELGYAPEQIGYQFRDLERLEEILEKAEKILAHAGIDTDVCLIIQGDTLDEQVQWLRKASNRLEREIELAKIELRLLLEDKGMREKMAMLRGSAEQKDRIRAEMQRRALQTEVDVDQMQAELAMLLSRDGQP